ncbi:cytoskeleton-associated protein 5-like isoform X3 [Halichondria panicea]|uniref:cytoskeleton-associated protein 5-like isoform X3 n=1 Tax=Halichondria panicea TaxID=6063 RepID=UPI00312BC369
MAEKEPEDYSKLSLEVKLAHKVWRARLMGYEEASKVFRKIDDEASSEYSKFTGMIKGFVTDSNQMAQEKGVEAALAFVESAAAASKVCSDVVTGIVTKCLNGRPKTKEGGILISLMFIEIEQFATVQEEIMKGFTHKQPKIVAASALVFNRALQEFGAKVINAKMLMKAVPALFEHSDKNVRAEAKALAIELFRWFGVAIKPTLEKHLKPVQLKELEEEWGKLPGVPPIPPRRLRSEQDTPIEAPAPSGGGDEDGVEDGGSEGAAMFSQAALDPYDLADPEEMLGKMPKDFYEKLADPKWKERKEVLETVLPLAQSIKLERGDYGELIKALKKVITKDSNVMVVALAGNIVTGLAKGLRDGFQSYVSTILSGIFEKFKEKKLNVVNSLRDAADAVYLTTSLGSIQEEVAEALNNKNPSVKSETLLFLCRCYQQCTPAMVPKPFLKALAPLTAQKLDDTTPLVREAAQEALGTMLRVVGDRPMNQYLEGVDKGKMAKIQEHRESVSLKIQTGIIPSPMKGQAAAGGGKEPPKGKKPEAKKLELAEESAEPVKKKKPAAASQKKPPKKKVEGATAAAPESKPAQGSTTKKPAASGGKAKGGSKGKAKSGATAGIGEPPDQPEPAIATEEVEEKANAVLPSGMLDRLADPKWKERLEACEEFKKFVEGLSPSEMQSLLFCKVLARKPGWKDSNFQVMNAKFAVVATLVEKAKVFGKKSTTCVLSALVDKFADMKVKARSGETLMILSERMTLNYITMLVMKAAFEQKSPKVQSESLDWLGQAIKAFGFMIKAKPHIDFVKKAFGASNPAVRTAAINVVGVMHLYLGAQVTVFFEEEKPALKQQIDDAIAKVSAESAPVPTRGPNIPGEDDGESEEEGDPLGDDDGPPPKSVSLADMMDKVDISSQIKPELIKEMADKNWKIRNESLQKVQEILKTAKFVKPSLGDLPGALKGRLSDSNKKLIITTLDIIKNLSTAMGSGCSKYLKTFIPGVLNCLGDSNPGVRSASLETLNAWHDVLTMNPMIEQELIANALSTESPNLRTELLGWLQEKLPECHKLPAEVNLIIPPLYSCLEDRSGEVRKKANATVPVLISKIGYEVMAKEATKLKGSSKATVIGIIEKHRSAAPSKPKGTPAPAAEPKKPPKAEKAPEKSTEKATKKTASGKPRGKAGSKASAGQKVSSSKKNAPEPSTGSPLVFVPNGKESRTKDEERMKTLKWNFQAPRTEHIDQLKEQLAPCVSTDLHASLFHDDFKKHLAALATLTKCVSGAAPHKEAATGCSDLLLRWITLRFFDTNTTVNMKCLEFLSALFKMLLTVDEYRMSDYEANAFLPYLVNKVGDSKDPVRKGVRALFRDICSFYPPAKLFTFLLDGLKSKNARQRTECLEELGTLIQYNGMTVCGAQPQKTVPIIAHQITDRDNTVRMAALNAIVVVYGNMGEGVYKFTSQLSEKDASLLEERIKRSGVKAPSSSQSSGAVKAPPPHSDDTAQPKQSKFKVKNVPSREPTASMSEPVVSSKENTPPSVEAPSITEPAPKVTGPFKKEELDIMQAPLPKIPQLRSRNMPNTLLTLTPTRQARTSEAISFIISQITSNDSSTCSKGIKQIEAVIVSPSQRPAITPHVDQLLRALLLQMRVNFSSPLTNASDSDSQKEVMDDAKMLTSCIVKVLEEPSLAILVSQDTLVELERDVVAYLTDERLLKLDDAAQLLRVFNYLMLRLCENCDKTSVYGSLLQLLAKNMHSGAAQSKQTDLIMKCIWKLTKLLPQFVSTVNLDRLLSEIHQCFEVYSKHEPPTPQMDVPIRTVKTILFHLINSVGEELLNHLALIRDSKHSQVTQYIQKTLRKKATSASSNGVPTAQSNPEDTMDIPLMPADLVATFSEILKKIGNPATKKQGLIELYSLKQKNKEFDLEKFFKKINVSTFYRSFIERGLREIDSEMNEGVKVSDHMKSDPNETSSSESIYAKHYKRLQQVQSRASQLMEISLQEKPTQREIKTVPTPDTKHTVTVPPPDVDHEKDASPSSKPKVDRSLYLEEMRRKLDRLKKTT